MDRSSLFFCWRLQRPSRRDAESSLSLSAFLIADYRRVSEWVRMCVWYCEPKLSQHHTLTITTALFFTEQLPHQMMYRAHFLVPCARIIYPPEAYHAIPARIPSSRGDPIGCVWRRWPIGLQQDCSWNQQPLQHCRAFSDQSYRLIPTTKTDRRPARTRRPR